MNSFSPQSHYQFQPLRDIKFPGFKNLEVQELLEKWSMKDGMSLQGFSYSPAYKEYLQSEFVIDFFSDASVINSLKVRSINVQGWKTISFKPNGVTQSKVPCNLTTTSVFDKLMLDENIVRHSGSLVKCCPHVIRLPTTLGHQLPAKSYFNDEPEMEVGNFLQRLVIKLQSQISNDGVDQNEKGGDDDEFWEEDICVDVLKEEKDEFLFKLFSHLVIGGSLCQYEDSVLPYIQVAKKIYKDLISVSLDKNESSHDAKLSVKSHVIKVHSVVSHPELPSSQQSLNSTTDLVFCKPRFNNFLYLVIDPDKSLVFTLYHQVV